MSIDWSKAPEGATHYQPESRGFHAAWFRLQGGKAREMWVVIPGGALEHIIDPTVFDESMQNLIARPAEPATWNGQGLPPVGTVCEHYGTADDLAWLEVEVIGHGNVDGRNVAFFRYGTGSPRFTVSYSTANNFRPIRTPEQIAAEEREKAIDAMLDLDPPHENGLGLTSRRQFCETLYDAGYRRQEEGK
ncbi:TPA: hypothetical protein NIE45_001424 [Pseudomonas aeruginosa]|nr:hypothetical protein [Pseudomonas aeruginosa]